MINEIRTRLMNRSSTDFIEEDTLGEEFIPPGFVAKLPDATLATILNDLLGPDGADRDYRNYRLHQLLTMAHSCGYDSMLRELDPRITYWPKSSENRDLVWRAYDKPGEIVQLPVGLVQTRKYLSVGSVGVFTANDASGLAKGHWNFSFYTRPPAPSTDNIIRVEILYRGDVYHESFPSLNVNPGVTYWDIPLPGTDMKLRLLDYAKLSGNKKLPSPLNSDISLDARARPGVSLTDVASRLAQNPLIPLVCRRTELGKRALETYNPTGPAWSVIGPVIVGVGAALAL